MIRLSLLFKSRKTRCGSGSKITSQAQDTTENMLDAFLAIIVHSSAIEGEQLNAFSVRSSLANRLGLTEEKPFPTTAKTDGLIRHSTLY